MKVGILDTKVNGQTIDDIELYRLKGYDVINASHVDAGKQFDILVSTWTRLNEKRLKACKVRAVVIKDNDEPGNVVDVDVLKRLNIPYGLIGLWGISTRVEWNMKQIKTYMPDAENVTMIANSPSHDALATVLTKQSVNVYYPFVPANTDKGGETVLIEKLRRSDVVIVHLGKDDYKRYWLDTYLPHFKRNSLMISTTRGPIYSADALNTAVIKNKVTAVLDWAWDEDHLVKQNIIHTGHSSYRSEQSGHELALEVVKAVEKIKKKLK